MQHEAPVSMMRGVSLPLTTKRIIDLLNQHKKSKEIEDMGE
jgi:hypothetical protein